MLKNITNGTVLCEDVKKVAEGDCPEVVGRAAAWAAEAIVQEFTDYQNSCCKK